MKTKFLFFISIFFIVTMFIYYNLHQYINNYDVVLVDNLESFDTKEIKLCLLNEKNEFEILDINIPNNIKEEEYIIKLLDDYRNSLPQGYRSPLYDTLQNKKIERVKNVININVDQIDNKTNINDLLVSLMWSYKYIDIDEINLITKEKTYNVDKDIKINPIYLSTTPSSSFVFYEVNKNKITPYTVYHEKEDYQIIMNLIGISYKDYSIYTKNNEIIIYLNENYSEEVIDEINYNFTRLFDKHTITIYNHNK